MSILPTWPIAIGTLVIGLIAGSGIDHLWMNHKVTAAEKRYDDLKDNQVKALALANAANAKRQDELQLAADESEMKRAVDNDQHAKDLAAVRTAARAGAVRLSIPGACRPAASAQAGAAAGPGAEERADILPGTADDLIRIAGDSARDVRDFNDLLDRYNAVCK